MVGVTHAAADLGLDVEGEAILGAAGQVVEMAAHRREEVLGAREPRRFLLGEHAELYQFADILDPIGVFGDPEEALEIAQAPLALLDVGLDVIARIAKLLVTCIALGELRADELAGAVLDDLGLEASLQLVEDGLVAPDITPLEQRRADRHVGARLAQAFLHRARRLPDLET